VSAAARVRENLAEIHSYMSENIDALLARGEGMEQLKERSSKLAESAKSLRRGAERLNLCRELQAWAIPLGVLSLVIIGLVLRFYVFADPAAPPPPDNSA
jgi:hypothetical protein